MKSLTLIPKSVRTPEIRYRVRNRVRYRAAHVSKRLPISVTILLTLGFAFGASTLFAAADPEPGKTWTLAIGISKYQHLPNDLWLQYPAIDAQTFARFIASPRGGAAPPEQIRVLTDEQATTAAIRHTFDTFLNNVGKNDTVFVLIAGHGTVDNTGAYVLTYDSDPGNLAGTALPMADLHKLVEEEVTHAGHVILLADVCRAAAIAGQKTTTLATLLEKVGETSGEMLGLMAARPKEVSFEGPTYGGGHGAFTWSVLQGLNGEADTDRDGFVTAGELIDYVSSDVPKGTDGKQHPRDFGNMENTTKLADLSRPGL
jgi:uncharacterized caspase-like protein